MNINTIKSIFFGSIVGIILLILLFGSWGTVPAGSRGVVLNMGRVTGEIKTEGFYMKLPIIYSVIPMSVQVKKEQVKTQAASKDLQTVQATVALNLSVSPVKCADIYQTIGLDYLTVIVAPALQESIKSIVAKYTAEELISKREVVRQGIAALISEKLSSSGIQTDAVNIVDFDFSRAFNEAIETKVTAEQNALASRNKLEQTKYEAEQQIVAAEGDAKAISIKATAIQNQGGDSYIKLKAIEKWDGKLPVYNTAGAPLPFLSIK